jgi:hypothetical protein
MLSVKITRDELVAHRACADELEKFDKLCPSGEVFIPEWRLCHSVCLAKWWPTVARWVRTKGVVPAFAHGVVNLSRANLSGANLSRADLFGANLSEANLFGANLSRADLFGANLSRANLSEANLFRANLFGANLSEANLFRANLFGADLFGADLTGADLSRADLSNATLPDGWESVVGRK